jgi:hypothetical protein
MVSAKSMKGKKRERSSISSQGSSTKNVKKRKAEAKSTKDIDIERAAAKAEFEAKKAEVDEHMPQSYRDMFGQIGFFRWSKTLLPVLILDPFDVPPGEVRILWLEYFDRVSVFLCLQSHSFLYREALLLTLHLLVAGTCSGGSVT